MFGDVWFNIVNCIGHSICLEEKAMRIILALLLCCFVNLAFADDQELNVYNWASYMPDDVIDKFEKETGIKVNYTTYDSNETLYAKLKADPNADYDIIVPSTYYVDRMRRQGMLLPIDKSQIPNFKNLNPEFVNREYDPNNEYSIPYLWSSTAIVVNDKYFSPSAITRWSDLWQSQYRNKLLMLDDLRDVFSIALITLGYSPNDANPQHIEQAYEKLRQLIPNIKLFNDDAEQAIYIDEDATIGMGWNGDIYMANQSNPNIHFIYPKDGFVIALDSMAIPAGAKHIANALKFINFVLRPDIAEEISMGVGYASPNLAAVKLMPEDVRNNPIIYAPASDLKRAQFQMDVGDADAVYEKYWELLKIGG